jgi:hypothetical protein
MRRVMTGVVTRMKIWAELEMEKEWTASLQWRRGQSSLLGPSTD